MKNPTDFEGLFLIADLSGYTALTEIHGNYSAMKFVERYLEMVNEALDSNSQLVERVGDEVLIISKQVESILNTAN